MIIDQAMLLAAGLGTRLRPITDTIPKPLVPVGGRPMIDRVLDHLQAAGVERAAVNVHHLAEQMEAHLARRQSPAITISDERDALLDSGGGVVRALPLLTPGPLFVMNTDLFFIEEGEPANLARLAGWFDPARMDIAMLTIRLDQATGHNGKLDFRRAADGRLTRFTAGDDPAEGVVYAGAFATTTALFADAPAGAFSLNRLFDAAIAAGRLYGLPLDGHWITVGTPEAIGAAEHRLGQAHG